MSGTESSPAAGAGAASAGGRRTSSAVGIITHGDDRGDDLQRPAPIVLADEPGDQRRHGHRRHPHPAETSETARLRWVSNQPVTQAIIGAKIADVAPRQQAEHELERRAATSPGSPARGWRREGRSRSSTISARPETIRQAAPGHARRRPWRGNPIVIAPDTPVADQPASRAIGVSSTGKENIAPIAIQPSMPPAATITQR